MTEAPVLETPRLILRGHRAEDLEASFALWGNPHVVAYIGGRPSTREESWSRILRYAGHWQLLGFGYWAIEEKASGRFAGDVGLADFRRQIEPSLDGVPEIGWVVDPAMQGQGYATEAIGAVLCWSREQRLAATTACIISPQNLASVRVAEKCGFEEFARTTYLEREVILLRRDD